MNKNLWGLAVACMSLWIMLVFREAANYFDSIERINAQLLDMRLITVSDYTISGWIPKALWNKHKKEHPDPNPTMTFMRRLWPAIEEQLQEDMQMSEDSAFGDQTWTDLKAKGAMNDDY